MNKMQIFEPAMCCSTGLCGVGVDPELLRISTVLNTLQKNGVKVDRFNLSNAPQEFITNQVVNKFIQEHGVNGLPITVVDNEIEITGRYPKNEDFIQLLNIPYDFINANTNTVNTTSNKVKVNSNTVRATSNKVKVNSNTVRTTSNKANAKSNGCGCSGGSCC